MYLPAMASMFDALASGLDAFSNFLWGWPLVILVVGGGLYFTLAARLVPLLHFGHAIAVLRGKYDDPDAPGQISHFRALSSALAATVGMGNISGVAVAIATGGPGALFWMWVTAFVGMATKYFTCTLSILYRGRDDRGEIQGGPMYTIVEGLGPRFRPLALMFSVAGLIGCLGVVQANQLTQILRDEVLEPRGWFLDSPWVGNGLIAIVIMFAVSLVIFGGIQRIALVASRLVPGMVLVYMAGAGFILLGHLGDLPGIFLLIVEDAFTGEAAAGGAVGALIILGIRRGAFSNEAGIGTEALAHGAARTNEPVREGLVAMLGPFIDTLIVCNVTGFAILATGVWTSSDENGVTLTVEAFESAMPGIGRPLMLVVVLAFSFSTMLGYSYYGGKCASFLFGTRAVRGYDLFYVAMLGVAAMMSLDAVLDLVEASFALMAIPTMTAALLLSPRVIEASRDYFSRLRSGEFRRESGPRD